MGQADRRGDRRQPYTGCSTRLISLLKNRHHLGIGSVPQLHKTLCKKKNQRGIHPYEVFHKINWRVCILRDDVPGFAKNMAMDTRYFPALFAVLVLSVMLIFFDKRTEPVKNWLVPSLAIYALGSSLAGYLQTMLFIRRQATLRWWEFGLILCFHAILFGSLLRYNFWRGSL